MELELLDKGFDPDRVENSIREIVESNRLLSMSTMDEEPHINTAFYTFDQELNLYILTPPDTEHGDNLEESSSIAVDIHDSHQEW